MIIHRILVPIDGSDHAEKALEFAIDLAQKYAAEITVITVVPHGALGFQEFRVYDGDFVKRAFYEKVLSEAADKAKKVAPSLEVKTRLVEGEPVSEIVKIAREGNFDVIVLGRVGETHDKHALLGSVSDHVADESSCTVIIVK